MFGPTGGTPGVSGGGGSGGGVSNTTLAGTWENVLVYEFDNDITRLTTRWRFEVSGACLKTTTTESLIEAIPRTSTRPCTYRVGAAEIVVTYLDVAETVRMTAFMPDPTVLRLDGIEYNRLL